MKLETKIIKQKGPLGVGEAIASVDGKVVVSDGTHLHGRIGTKKTK